MEENPNRPLENRPKNWTGGNFLNVPGFNSEMVKVSDDSYETAQDDVEYYSPNQHGGIYGTVYRQYFTTTLPATLTSGKIVSRLVDCNIMYKDGSVRKVISGIFDDSTNSGWIQLTGLTGDENLVLAAAGNVTVDKGWVDYTK